MLRSPDFRRLWLSNAITNFGAQITMLALPICAALLLHASAGQMGFLAACETLEAREPAPARKDTHPLRDMIDGLAYVWHHRLLRKRAFISGGWHLMFYGFNALQVLFALRVLGLAPGVMGMANMLGGVGVLAGSMLVKPLATRFGTGTALLAGQVISGAGFILLPAIEPTLFGGSAAAAAAYAVVMFCVDCGATLFFIPYGALRQKVTPDAMLGRMIATMRFLTVAMAPIGAALAGGLGERFGVRSGLLCVGAGACALVLATAFASGLRQVKE